MKAKRKINNLATSASTIRLTTQITTFDNGLTVITDELPYIESFSLGIGVAVGSRHDFDGKEGIAHFLEHSVYRRTKKRSSRQIAIQLDNVGAYSNAYTTKELTLFYVRATKFHFHKCFEILSDIVLNPVFLESEINKERQIIIEEIKSYDDDPEEYIFDIADEVIFPNHQLGHSIDGSVQSLLKTNENDLRLFHENFYNPQNIVIAVAGNISHDIVVAEAEKYFSCFKNVHPKPTSIAPTPLKNEKFIQKSIQQAHLILGKQINWQNNKNKYALSLLNIIFGDGMSSRLYQNLREKKGLAYSVFSQLNFYSDCGSLVHYIATDSSKILLAEELILKELQEISKNRIKKSEFLRAKEQLKTAKILEFESVSARMQNIIKNYITQNKIENLQEIISDFENISFDDINYIIENEYNENNLCKIMLFPKSKGYLNGSK